MKLARKYIISLTGGVVIGIILTNVMSVKFCIEKVNYFRRSGNGRSTKLLVPNRLREIKLIANDLAGNEQYHSRNSSIADSLKKKIRILCWVLSGPDNHLTKLIHVKNTWGKRCNTLLLMSSVRDERVGTIALNVSEGRDQLWKKTHAAFEYVYKHHKDDADWFLKADDDTFVVVENLRNFLAAYSPDQPIYFGYKFHSAIRQGYMSGGAGYVLSKEALERLITVAFKDPNICNPEGEVEDLRIGQCLEGVNVLAGDSRDSLHRERFLMVEPEYILRMKREPEMDFWFFKNQYYLTDYGLKCCSDLAITFHYIIPSRMKAFYYFLYRLHPYGVLRHLQELPDKVNFTAVKKRLISELPTKW